jgi:hypothetical protein
MRDRPRSIKGLSTHVRPKQQSVLSNCARRTREDAPMKKYFFDLVSLKGCSYDYTGQLLPGEPEALDIAELIALDLASTTSFDWVGTVVKVKDAAGTTLFAVPVEHLQAVAA